MNSTLSPTTLKHARTGIKSRLTRIAASFDRYCVKGYFEPGESDIARHIAKELRFLSEAIK